MSMWEELAVEMNANIARNKDNTSNIRKYARKEVTAEEAIRFYGLLMMIESSYGNNTANLRAHFSAVKSEFEEPEKIMGIDRFTILRGAFYGSSDFLKKVCDEFHLATTKHISQISVVVGDEAVAEYQPAAATKKKHEKMGDPIPVIYIPRKPHPNGFLFYLLATFVSDPTGLESTVPYVLDIIPHLSAGDVPPVETIKEFLKRWTGVGAKPVVVLDAGFSSLQLIASIKAWGGHVVMSSKTDTLEDVWQALSTSLPPHFWHAAVRDDGLVASCHAAISTKGEKTEQYVLTTIATPVVPAVVPAVVPTVAAIVASTATAASTVPIATVAASTVAVPTTTIAAPITVVATSLAIASPAAVAASPATVTATTATIAASTATATAPTSSSVAVPEVIPLFSEETLNKMTIVELKAICTKWNIKSGKKKANTIQLIRSRSVNMNTNLDTMKQMANRLHSYAIPDPAPIHDFYKAYFNFIDINDRRWYAVNEHHGNQVWRSKFLQCILRYAVLNVWAHASKREYQLWKDFHADLAVDLATYNL